METEEHGVIDGTRSRAHSSASSNSYSSSTTQKLQLSIPLNPSSSSTSLDTSTSNVISSKKAVVDPTIEEELWNIFTNYSLHADPGTLDLLRPATFLRFVKDCQISSKHLSLTEVELEIAKLKGIPKLKADEFSISNCAEKDGNISFQVFLLLLEHLSTKVYPRDRPEIALKRFLLENVLLLASRQAPIATIDMRDHLRDPDAIALLKKYEAGLRQIFEYYLTRSTKRRNEAVNQRKVLQRDLELNYKHDVLKKFEALQHTETVDSINFLVKQARRLKDCIGYKEFVQFCYDFQLRSTNLLSAFQVGEVFLGLIPFSATSTSESSINFNNFCHALLYMALLAYSDCDSKVTVVEKLQALFLYMWKAVDISHATKHKHRDDKLSVNKLSNYVGLTLYGAGAFCEKFLADWVVDEYRNYATYSASEIKQGNARDHLGFLAPTIDEEDINGGQKKMVLSQESNESHSLADDSKSFISNSVVQAFENVRGIKIDHDKDFNIKKQVERPQKIVLKGTNIAELLERRPALEEHILLEIKKMKAKVPNMKWANEAHFDFKN